MIAEETKELRSACAAIMACGVGCASAGLLYLLGDRFPFWNRWLSLNQSVGALSGVLCGTVVLWVIAWIASRQYWKKKTPSTKKIVPVALMLLAMGLLLTFPPFVRLFR